MPYPLNINNDPKRSLVFWIEKFMKNKISTLSTSTVKSKDIIAEAIVALNAGGLSKAEMVQISKKIRNAGMPGVNSILYPIFNLYDYIDGMALTKLEQISEEVIIDFLVSSTSSFADETKKNWRNSILSFFGYIEAQNEDPLGRVHLFRIKLKNWGGLSGKSGGKNPSYLSRDEAMKMLSALNVMKFRNEKVRQRNILLVKIILFTGIRVGEAISLRPKDIVLDDEDYLISVRGKGNKPRVMMLAREAIHDHIDAWYSLKDMRSPYVFHAIAKPEKSITQAYASRIVEKTLLSAGIRKNKNGAHMLRHSFATHLYGSTGDLLLLKEALGHSDISTSMRYTHFDKKRMKAASNLFKEE